MVPESLDRSAFSEVLSVSAAVVPVSSLSEFLKLHRPSLFQRSNTKPVLEIPDKKSHKLVLLSCPVASEYEIVQHEITVTYESQSLSEIVNKLLPESLRPGPSAFETIGHIAHFNLDGYLDPDSEELTHYSFRNLIAQICLDKFPNIRTVVHKRGSINSEFRVFDMHVLAGDTGPESLVATVKEGGLTFRVPYSEVYWNSRLNFERERVLAFMKEKAVDVQSSYLIDMFAGVGALACMAAKSGFTVLANDLNPAGARAMSENAERNRVNLGVHNQDAREFVRTVVPELAVDSDISHLFFMMNLPEIAIEFMDVFPGLLADLKHTDKLPEFRLMCHCFARADPPDAEILTRVKHALGVTSDLAEFEPEIVLVRDVAPNKKMYCVNLKLSEQLLRRANCKRPRIHSK